MQERKHTTGDLTRRICMQLSLKESNCRPESGNASDSFHHDEPCQLAFAHQATCHAVFLCCSCWHTRTCDLVHACFRPMHTMRAIRRRNRTALRAANQKGVSGSGAPSADLKFRLGVGIKLTHAYQRAYRNGPQNDTSRMFAGICGRGLTGTEVHFD